MLREELLNRLIQKKAELDKLQKHISGISREMLTVFSNDGLIDLIAVIEAQLA